MESDTGGPHIGNLTLVFPEFEDRMLAGLNSGETLKKIRADLTDLAGAEIKVEKQKEGPPTGTAVTARFIGKDNAKLQQASEAARLILANNPVPGLVNLRSDWVATRPELAFHVNRRRAVLQGVSAAVIGNFLKTALFGREVGIYRQLTEEYDITLRLPLDQREHLEDLLRLRIPSGNGTPVPLSSLGEFVYTGGLGTIRHVDAKPVITLTADAEGRQGNEVLADVQKILEKLPLPSGVEIRYAGEKEEQDEGTAFLFNAFLVALGLIALILIMQFNTFSVPLIIMSTVILSLIGVLAGLLICHMPFGVIMTGVGVISLAGVVVNNAIVLLDYTRLLQRRGKELVEAAIEAGATRLRPVFLTAVTTLLGLVPMAVGISFDFTKMRMAWYSESSQWWASMAIAVIFGLGFATILTLVVVPTLYVVLYRAAAKMGLGGLHRPGEDELATQPVMEDF
jgi:multidrug efflux pump subunit AcrB